MKQKKSHRPDVYQRLVELDEKTWNYFSDYETDRAFALNHQFYYYYLKNAQFLDINNIYLHHLLSKQNIIYKTLGGDVEDKNSTIAKDDKKFVYYETDIDTNEVLNFTGFLKISNPIPIRKVYEHIDWYLKKYEKSSKPISILFNYGEDKVNDEIIKFEIHYENDGIIQLELDTFGVFRGETLSFLKMPHENFNYEDDFLNKFDDILTYFKKSLK